MPWFSMSFITDKLFKDGVFARYQAIPLVAESEDDAELESGSSESKFSKPVI